MSETAAAASPLEDSQQKKGDLSYHFWAGKGGGTAPTPTAKKLTNEEAIELERSNSSSLGTGASAWNAAGTWEEKDFFGWAKDSIKEHLVGLGPTLAAGTGEITGIEKCTGEANVVCVRGKIRHGYDLDVTFEWSVSIDDKETKGTMRIPEISIDTVHDDELQCEVKVAKPKKAHATQEAEACTSMKSLLPAIREALLKFDQAFKKKAGG